MKYGTYKIIAVVTVGLLLSFSFASAKNFTIHNATNVNQPYFSVNGTSGNIGIGLTNPTTPLQMLNNSWISARNAAGTGAINMFKVNANDQIEVGAPLNIGSFEFSPDSGLVTFVDMPVSSASALGTPQGYVFKADGDNILTIYSEANGTGGVQNKRIGIGLTNPTGLLHVAGTENIIFNTSGNVGIASTTPVAKLALSGGTGNVFYAGGGQIAGLNSTPTNADQAVPLGYLQSNYAPIGSGVGSAFVQGGNTFGAIANLGTNDNYSLNLKTNNAARMTITSNGNVGIGTTSPVFPVDIYSAGKAILRLDTNSATEGSSLRMNRSSDRRENLIYNSTGGVIDWTFGSGLYNSGAVTNDWGVSTDGNLANAKLIIRKDSGNVGIGTIAPSRLLNLHEPSTGNAYFKISNNTSGNVAGGDGFDFMFGGLNMSFVNRENGFIAFETNNAEKVRITNTGNVGLGTTAPNTILHIKGASPILRVEASGGSQEAALNLDAHDNTGTSAIYFSRVEDLAGYYGKIGWTGDTGGAFTFSTGGAAVTEKMRLTNAGNLGIGSTTPITKLMVSGGTGDLINVSGGQVAGLNSTPLNPDHAVPLGYLQANYTPASGSLWSGAKNSSIWNGDSGVGNVGIGTTNPNAKLEVYADTGNEFSVYDGYYTFNIGGDAFNDGSNAWSISKNSSDALYNNEIGGHIFRVDNAEKMRVDRTGNVAVGTSTPLSQFHLYGTGQNTAALTDAGATGGLLFVDTANENVGSGGGIAFGATGNRFAAIKGLLRNVGTYYSGDLAFSTRNISDATLIERMRINGYNGYIGIGTTNPGAALEVSNAVNTPFIINSDGGVPGLQIKNSGVLKWIIADRGANSDNLYFAASPANTSGANIAAAAKLTVQQNGNVGIGTTIPRVDLDFATTSVVNKIHVAGGYVAGLDSTPISPDHAVPLGYLQANYSSTSSSLWSGTKNGTIWNGDSGAGNVGIGIVNPGAKLDVSSNNNPEIKIYDSGAISANGIGMRLVHHLDSWSDQYFGLKGTPDGATSTDYLRIKMDSGNTGIGTTNPAEKLHVIGTARFEDSGSGRYIGFDINSGNQGILTSAGNLNIMPATGMLTLYKSGAASAFNMWDGSSSYRVLLNTNGSSYFNGGSVGIGITNPGAKLDVSSSAVAGNNLKIQTTVAGSEPSATIDFYAHNTSSGATAAKLEVKQADYQNNAMIFSTESSNVMTEKMRIHTNGSVGINTSSPVTKLAVNGGTSNVIYVGGGYVAGLDLTPFNADQAVPLGYLQANYTSTSTNFWQRNGSSLAPKTISDNVGIGTTTASKKLTILTPDNDIGLRLVGTGGETYDIGETAGNEMKISSQTYINLSAYHRASSDIQIRNADIIMRQPTYFTVGNVGIGTTTPIADLEIKGRVGTNATALKVTSDGNATDKVFHFTGNEAAGFDMVMTQTGNVGIGTTTPLYKLSLIGDINLDVNSKYRINGNAVVKQPGGYIEMGLPEYSLGGASTQYWANASGAFITFISSSTEKMRITNNGNVGIGTTAPSGKLSVSGGNVNIFPNGRLTIDKGAGGSSGGGYFEFVNSNPGIVIGITDNSDNNHILFKTRPVDNIERERMRITAGGNIGIGTTSPAALLAVGTTNNVSVYAGGRYVAGLDLTPISPDQAVPLGYLQANYNASSTSYWSGSLGGNIWSANTSNVGIGTTTPSEKVEILGRLKISGNATGWSSIGGIEINDMYNSVNARRWAILGGLSAQGSLDFRVGTSQFGDPWANGTTTMTILRNGYVGIGTYNPQRLLEVAGSNSNDVPLSLYRPGCNWTGCGLRQEFALQDSSNIRKVFAALVAGITTPTTGAEDGIFAFMTMKSGTLTEGMRLNKDGYLGIGTTNPGAKLGVNIADAGTTLGSSGSVIKLANTNSTVNNIAAIDFPQDAAGSGFSRIGVIYKSRTSGAEAQDMFFRTIGNGSSLEVMRLTSGGNVGIGITNPAEKLSVNGSGGWNMNFGSSAGLYLGQTGGTSASLVGQNIKAAGSDGNFDVAASHASFGYRGLVFDYSGGATSGIQFYAYHGAVNAGDVLSNERMRITNAGNVGIGTTSPVAKFAISTTDNVSMFAGGRYLAGLDLTPINPDQAVPLGYLQSNYSSTSSSLWTGTKNGNIWNGDSGSGNVGIGITNPVSKLHVNGGVSLKRTPVADTNYTAQADDYIIGYTSISANRTVTLPNALCTPGRFFVVVDESGNASASAKIIIDPESTTPIIGLQTLPLEDSFNSVYVFCGNNAWYIL